MNNNAVIITGGAGFIGSHLTARVLREGQIVTVLDNFSSGKPENLKHLRDPSLTILQEDLKKPKQLEQVISQSEYIYHFAANPEVRVGETDPKVHFEENILATFNLLEAIRQARARKIVVFASTSTVYGDASEIPTPENYGPLIPISTYGASKLACEAMIASYAYTFNQRALILRFANIVGPRSNHGVIPDFTRKIRSNPHRLEILGDGNQEKSYLYIDDCIAAITQATGTFLNSPHKVDVYNIGSPDKITVKEIAKIVAEEMNKPDIEYVFTGGIDGGRGWKGDVKTMQLSIEKLLNTGWKPKHKSEAAVRLAAKYLISNQ